jgi:hypothetical protein
MVSAAGKHAPPQMEPDSPSEPLCASFDESYTLHVSQDAVQKGQGKLAPMPPRGLRKEKACSRQTRLALRGETSQGLPSKDQTRFVCRRPPRPLLLQLDGARAPESICIGRRLWTRAAQWGPKRRQSPNRLLANAISC